MWFTLSIVCDFRVSVVTKLVEKIASSPSSLQSSSQVRNTDVDPALYGRLTKIEDQVSGFSAFAMFLCHILVQID